MALGGMYSAHSTLRSRGTCCGAGCTSTRDYAEIILGESADAAWALLLNLPYVELVTTYTTASAKRQKPPCSYGCPLPHPMRRPHSRWWPYAMADRRHPDAERILAHLGTVATRLGPRAWWTKYAFHFTELSNVTIDITP